jgi:nitrogenase molybdenum-iron protein beta chain
LHGAIKALSAVEGLVPVLHASAGCSLGARYGENSLAGSLGGAAGWQETSATNLQEKHVVFGGTSRLREQLKNTVKVLKGDLYVVATGCVPETVGDDVPAMVKESREQRYPVIGIATPGFKGNAWHGYATATRQVLEQLPTLDDSPRAVQTDLVNLLGVAPGLDPFWEGDLLELQGALELLGIRVQRLFGIGERIASWKNVRNAGLNIVISPWGLEAARFLDARDAIPYLDFGHLPVGSRDVASLLAQVIQALDLPFPRVDELARSLDARQRHFLRKAAPALLAGQFQRRTAVVAPSATAVGVARFLSGTLGQILTTLVVTDDPPEETRANLVRLARESSEGIEIDVFFAESAADVRRILSEAKVELVLGSSLERSWADSSAAVLVEIANPLREDLVLDRSLAGTSGALHLVSRISRALLAVPVPDATGIRHELQSPSPTKAGVESACAA